MTSESGPPPRETATTNTTTATVPQPVERVFADSYRWYVDKGWPVVPITIPSSGKKGTPPTGFTGRKGVDASLPLLDQWAGNGYGDHNIALRAPHEVLGLDVDDYVKGGVTKSGTETLAHFEAMWGPLPPTWCSTARGTDAGPGPSHIRFFRVPPGEYASELLRPGEEKADVEIVQRHHRYAIVAPSRNPEAGNAPYRWYRPDDSPAADGEVPGPADLPWLPAAWVVGMRKGDAQAGSAGDGGAALAAMVADDREACAEMSNAFDRAELLFGDAESGERHPVMRDRVRHLVGLAGSGHPGIGPVLDELRALWVDLTGEDREAELERMISGAALLACPTGVPVDRDPCLLMAGGVAAVTTAQIGVLPVADGVAVARSTVEPHPWRWWIKAHPFDPAAGTDQGLAAAVLERTRPMLRYAADTTNGWLKRGPDCWELHGDLTARAVSEVAELMPPGEPAPLGLKKAEYTEANWTAARRNRFQTTASAGAIAGKMRAAVQGGGHPSAVNVADLDADPEVLWAGGVAWNLRASGTVPTPAHWIDEGEPHMRSAAVRPDATCPMPRWEAFITAVWPNEAVRLWALRVLSIALTGSADRALPVLLGPPNTGKTSFVELMMEVLGSYAHAANPKLLATQDNSHDTIVFSLKGRRLSFIDEGLREGKWAQERLKHLTGGGSLTGRAMKKDEITFKATHTLIVTSNAEPVLTDDAVRSRVRLIPCEGDVATVLAARAALTPQALAAEAPGILAGFMSHAAAWLADRSSSLTSAAPSTINGRADELAKEQDPIRRWLDEMCEPSAAEPSGELFRYFVVWCEKNNVKGLAIPSVTAWGRALTKAGYPPTHTNTGSTRKLHIRQGDFGLSNIRPAQA